MGDARARARPRADGRAVWDEATGTVDSIRIRETRDARVGRSRASIDARDARGWTSRFACVWVGWARGEGGDGGGGARRATRAETKRRRGERR